MKVVCQKREEKKESCWEKMKLTGGPRKENRPKTQQEGNIVHDQKDGLTEKE